MSFSVKTRVLIDKSCTWSPLPLFPTINAAIDLRQRSIYKEALNSGSTDPKYQDAYHQRILKTKKWVLCTLLIPILGQIIVGIYYLAKKCMAKSATPSDQMVSLSGIAKLEAKANAGDPQAEYDLAKVYVGSTHSALPTLDTDKALHLYQSAANRQFAPALFELSLWYMNTNLEESLKALKKASDLGFAPAQVALGMRYTGIWSGAKNDEDQVQEGFELIQSGAEKNDKLGLAVLGECYEKGVGTIQDTAKALESYKLALKEYGPSSPMFSKMQRNIDALEGKPSSTKAKLVSS